MKRFLVLALAVLLVTGASLAVVSAQRGQGQTTIEQVPKTFTIKITAPDGHRWKCTVNANLVVQAAWNGNNEPTAVQILRSARDPNNSRNTLSTSYTIDPASCVEL